MGLLEAIGLVASLIAIYEFGMRLTSRVLKTPFFKKPFSIENLSKSVKIYQHLLKSSNDILFKKNPQSGIKRDKPVYSGTNRYLSLIKKSYSPAGQDLKKVLAECNLLPTSAEQCGIQKISFNSSFTISPAQSIIQGCFKKTTFITPIRAYF